MTTTGRLTRWVELGGKDETLRPAGDPNHEAEEEPDDDDDWYLGGEWMGSLTIRAVVRDAAVRWLVHNSDVKLSDLRHPTDTDDEGFAFVVDVGMNAVYEADTLDDALYEAVRAVMEAGT